MKLLNTYDDKDEAEEAAEKLQGQKRLASEQSTFARLALVPFSTSKWCLTILISMVLFSVRVLLTCAVSVHRRQHAY